MSSPARATRFPICIPYSYTICITTTTVSGRFNNVYIRIRVYVGIRDTCARTKLTYKTFLDTRYWTTTQRCDTYLFFFPLSFARISFALLSSTCVRRVKVHYTKSPDVYIMFTYDCSASSKLKISPLPVNLFCIYIVQIELSIYLNRVPNTCYCLISTNPMFHLRCAMTFERANKFVYFREIPFFF